MGDPRGFMTVDRKTYSERDPAERIGDWNEFQLELPVAELQGQGSSCMDCGVPFCHTGDLIATLSDGRTVSANQPCLRGGRRQPLTPEDLETKFMANARFGGWDDADAKRLLSFARSLFEVSDLSELKTFAK